MLKFPEEFFGAKTHDTTTNSKTLIDASLAMGGRSTNDAIEMMSSSFGAPLMQMMQYNGALSLSAFGLAQALEIGKASSEAVMQLQKTQGEALAALANVSSPIESQSNDLALDTAETSFGSVEPIQDVRPAQVAFDARSAPLADAVFEEASQFSAPDQGFPSQSEVSLQGGEYAALASDDATAGGNANSTDPTENTGFGSLGANTNVTGEANTNVTGGYGAQNTSQGGQGVYGAQSVQNAPSVYGVSTDASSAQSGYAAEPLGANPQGGYNARSDIQLSAPAGYATQISDFGSQSVYTPQNTDMNSINGYAAQTPDASAPAGYASQAVSQRVPSSFASDGGTTSSVAGYVGQGDFQGVIDTDLASQADNTTSLFQAQTAPAVSGEASAAYTDESNLQIADASFANSEASSAAASAQSFGAGQGLHTVTLRAPTNLIGGVVIDGDDLSQLPDLDADIVAAFNEIGVHYYFQMAEWTASDWDYIATYMQQTKGFEIGRYSLLSAAKSLSAQRHHSMSTHSITLKPPKNLIAGPVSDADDLTTLPAITQGVQNILNESGIHYFSQIRDWQAGDWEYIEAFLSQRTGGDVKLERSAILRALMH